MNIPDRTGRTEFAIQFGITAMHALLAHINLIFHAHILSFSVRMIDTGFHFGELV
jgi:hypothetical protein